MYSYGELVFDYGENVVVKEGTTSINPWAIRNWNVVSLSLPSSLATITSVMISENATKLETIYLRSNISFNSEKLLSATPKIYVSGSVTGELACEYVNGRFIEHDKGTVFLFLNDPHADLTFLSDENAVAFSVEPYSDYDESVIVVKIGETVIAPLPAGSGKKIGETDVSGMYYITVSGDLNIDITGIELNTFSVTLPSDTTGYEITGTPGFTDVDVNTKILFSVDMLPGYVAETGFKVTLDGNEITPTYSREGYYLYEFILLKDSAINVDGVVSEGVKTVTFDSKGGSNIEPQTIPTGAKATYTAPTYDGHDFMGWFADTELKVLYDFDAPVIDNINLYAKWATSATNKFTVTFESERATIVAIAYGNTPIDTGTEVYDGAIIKFVATPPLNYDVQKWIINGADIITFENEMSLEIVAATTVSVVCEYRVNSTYVNVNEVLSPIPGHHVHLWTYGEGTSGDSSAMMWTEMIYAPAIYGDFIYAKSDQILLKINANTGELVKSVQTAREFSGYYEKVAVGNGLIFDGPMEGVRP